MRLLRPRFLLPLAVVLAATATLALAQPAPRTVPDTLNRIRTAKEIRVAFSGDSLPFSHVAANGEPAGFAIDLCRRVIADIRRTLALPELQTRWILGSAAERVAMVAGGKADLDCANTTASLSRMREVDFSALVFVDSGGLMVKADAATRRLADLAGKNIGVLAGTTTEARLDALLKQTQTNARVTRLNEGGEGIAMLESGSLDAFAGDKIKLIGLAAQGKDPQALALLPEDLSYEPLAFALPRDDSAFRLEVDRALSRIYASGEIERIFDRWLGRLGRPSGLLAALYLLHVIPE